MTSAMKGRGALSQPPGRFDKLTQVLEHDGWYEEEAPDKVETIVRPEPARSIISRNSSPDIHFSQSINPYRGCEHACIYCGGPETPIYMADGSTKRLDELSERDSIFGTERQGVSRRYVTTRVLAHWSVVKPAAEVALRDGRTLTLGLDHRLLTQRGWKFVSGARRTSLEPGDRLMGLSAADKRIAQGDVVGTSDELTITRITPLDRELRLFDITTGTEDFIANGVVSHNCYARPSHAYVGLSPGLDFETKLFFKQDAAKLLEKELANPSYKCSPLMIGANTDPYQPIEREHRVTRSLLEVLVRTKHPASITTKGALVARDVDLLAQLARDNLIRVMFSVPTLDAALKRALEPRAASPAAKLKAMRVLTSAGVPVGVLVAPIIPVLTEHEVEAILEAAREAGATIAGYTMLRLPWEVKDLFREWLAEHFPDRAAHVMSIVRGMRGERDNDPNFGTRMKAVGPFADLVRQRFRLATRRLGYTADSRLEMPTHLFSPPRRTHPQMTLEL